MKVLGFNEDRNTCDRCGKTELKGTWEIENHNGEIFRLGTSCIAKKFELEPKEAKALITNHKKEKKNKSLYEKHITPIKEKMKKDFDDTFMYEYDKLDTIAKEIYNKKKKFYDDYITLIAEKKKITL